MSTRCPWGDGPAPALCCDECGKQIGRRRIHCLIADRTKVLCATCMSDTRAESRLLHAKYYPQCPVSWHDMYDHGPQLATRAAAWLIVNGVR